MYRWIVSTFLAAYLSFLALGVAAHTFNFGTGAHPLMYFVVWDMFCGWSAHEYRVHAIAEGESGEFYDVTCGPWGDVKMYGDHVERMNFDSLGNVYGKIVNNTLKHTQHEPILRTFIVEESWSKKYNLPDVFWKMRFEEPKEKYSYFWTRATLNPDGSVQSANPTWGAMLYAATISDNPRLQADSRRSTPFMALDHSQRLSSSVRESEIVPVSHSVPE